MNDLKRKFLAMVQDDLDGIEDALEANLNPYLDLVRQTASHLIFSGGKRFRPLLMVLGDGIGKRVFYVEGNSDSQTGQIFTGQLTIPCSSAFGPKK